MGACHHGNATSATAAWMYGERRAMQANVHSCSQRWRRLEGTAWTTWQRPLQSISGILIHICRVYCFADSILMSDRGAEVPRMQENINFLAVSVIHNDEICVRWLDSFQDICRDLKERMCKILIFTVGDKTLNHLRISVMKSKPDISFKK